MTDGKSAVYKQANIASGEPVVKSGNPPAASIVTDVGGEFYSGTRRSKLVID